jgi:hypothetical protein
MAADHAHPERAWLIAFDEVLDVLAGPEQKNPLPRDQSDSAAENGRTDEQVAQREQHADRGCVVDQHPAARIDRRDLRQEAQRQQADERHVPQLDRAA